MSDLKSKQASRPADAARKMGISVPTLYRWAKDKPNFPKLRKLSDRVTIILDDEIEKFMLGTETGAEVAR